MFVEAYRNNVLSKKTTKNNWELTHEFNTTHIGYTTSFLKNKQKKSKKFFTN